MADATFWDRIADRYAARQVSDPQAYADTLDRVRHWLRPEWDVLELGCGTGTTALALVGGVRRMTATDLSPAMIEIARAKPDCPASLRFEVAGAADAIRPGTHDAILAFNLLHLVTDLPDLLGTIRQGLRPGGMFLSKTPCIAGKHHYRPLIAALQLFGKAPRPIHFLSTAGLEQQIATAGFEIVETGDYPARPPSRLVVARVP
ncbi:class I SAM-dependent DNA methyltransferase [Pseudoponticoccus marisrubri]|uniref:Ubiquinone biosynthesis protein UbiE n=1 Tax=Pseudoponticoccus marisrubri TaxID=1685382 RepID=A0A0W7WIZ7_9RHOB|nr:class I SAM-dependent methyltransferase [Pseudoponticoccus marisrubri]KUF10456.1 hypothetical protein AVJ23_11235 [Pseudoponticoccus marisrubri]